VLFQGFQGIAAPLLFVSPTQINAQVPSEQPDLSTISVVAQGRSRSLASARNLGGSLLTVDHRYQHSNCPEQSPVHER
jgi:uncharacterized protein (TIGR03437 family)